MDAIWRAVGYVMLIFTVAMTVLMLVTFRRPRRITLKAMLAAIAFSLVMLPVYMLLSGARLNPVLAAPAMGLGLIAGFAWGFATRLSGQRGQVVGRRSLLFLVGWGLSWVLSQGLNLLGSAPWASAGLLPLFFSTGTHVGSSSNLFLRVLFYRPRAAPALALPGEPHALPPAVQQARARARGEVPPDRSEG